VALTEWKFAQRTPAQRLAQVTWYSVTKTQDGKEIEFLITIKEYVTPKDPSMLFYAEADKEVNQDCAPHRPVGWGRTLLEALSSCMEQINRFPFQPRC